MKSLILIVGLLLSLNSFAGDETQDPIVADLRNRFQNAAKENNPIPADLDKFKFNCMSHSLKTGDFSKQAIELSFRKADKYFEMVSNSMFDGVTFIIKGNSMRGVTAGNWQTQVLSMLFVLEKDGTLLGVFDDNFPGPPIGNGGLQRIDVCPRSN